MTLSTQELMLIEQRISNERKSTGLAYALWFFLGGLSMHRFYLGCWKLALVQMLCVPVGIVMMLSKNHFGFFVLGFGLSWLFIDLFMIPSLVNDHKESLRRKFTTG